MNHNKETEPENIELNTDGLFYDDMLQIYQIKDFIKMDIDVDEVYRINGKFIVLKEFFTEPKFNIDELDVGMMENTFLTKYLRMKQK